MFSNATKGQGKTVLLLDVENGSVGSALSTVSRGEMPRLFSESRLHFPLTNTRDSTALAKEIALHVQQILANTSVVAARIRQGFGGQTSNSASWFGVIERAAVFLGAPWGAPSLELSRPVFVEPLRAMVRNEIATIAPNTHAVFYTGADIATTILHLFNNDDTLLLCIMRGEMVELMLVSAQKVLGYATLPVGQRTIVRTLKTHAGVSEQEAQSLLALVPHMHTHAHEPLQAAGQHIVEQFMSAATELLNHAGSTHHQLVNGVLVVAQDSAGEWFARTLSSDPMVGSLFPSGASVRSLKSHHFMPYVAAHAPVPDLFLLLQALFVNARA